VNLALASDAQLADEVPVALVFNGISHAVMMATPLHLEDFALGFALTEGLVDHAQQVYGVEVLEHAMGLEVHIDIAAQCETRLKERRRQSVAAKPEENANPRDPFSILANANSNAVLVGLAALLYS